MTEPAPAAPSSTILLVRDSPDLEVLMVVRHHQIDFASGALVFPGGKVDPADRDAGWAAHVEADPDWDAEERALRIGAVREAFEESGVLLARTVTDRGLGRPLAPVDATIGLAQRRAALALEASAFQAAVAEAGLVLALDALTPFAHWVTPLGMPKRFDTWFYVAAAPADQAAACDGREAVEACWVRPGDALADLRSGRRKIIFPTRLNLEKLGEAGTVAAALAQARSRSIVTVTPRVTREDDGTLMLRIPEEAGYSVTVEPLDGNMP